MDCSLRNQSVAINRTLFHNVWSKLTAAEAAVFSFVKSLYVLTYSIEDLNYSIHVIYLPVCLREEEFLMQKTKTPNT